ncbi:N-methyltryptophan oxidase [Microlunatus endophyticus]|uniref:N-methyltryptophan oxidase n=1 Tax=Microlunatus endophyticus TaxID=1716077 RepID=A0A917SCW0_9ACTN|nr:FAD-dependent oxidoreductase [Microlunatus endophyticus]GGL73223.1 N-methyltryptophan oxidase [Microlunatus endophyticus]
MSTQRVDVVVVGAGLAGAAAAWELTNRGYSVVIVEQFEVGHAEGSSHGTSRIYRRAYLDPFYIRLTGRAEREWDRLEDQAGIALRTRTGGLDAGRLRHPTELIGLLRQQGVAAELLPPEEITERWPGIDLGEPAVFHDQAGYLDAGATVRTLVGLAVGGGAVLAERCAVERLSPCADGIVAQTADGSWRAGAAVVAVGSWLPNLMNGFPSPVVTPRITVKQQEVFHLPRRTDVGDPDAIWPTLVYKDEVEIYALTSGADGGQRPAYKIGQFDSVSDTTADNRDKIIDPVARAVCLDFAGRHLPGLEHQPSNEQSCLFTMTADEDFVIDRIGPIVVASPCSGHGAKFAPLTGVLIADLVEGGPAVPRFAFRT